MPLLAVLLFCSLGARGQSGGFLKMAWDEISEMPVPMANNATAAWNDGGDIYLYSFGGIDSSLQEDGINLRSWRYNITANSWMELDPMPDTLGKIAAGANRVGDRIYVIGGYHVFDGGNELSSDRVHIFDCPSNSWLADGAAIPVAIDDQVQAVWRDSLIYVITGWSDITNVPDVQIYDPALDTWQVGTSVPATGNYMVFGGSGSIIGDTIYYSGGARVGFNFPLGNVLRKGVIDPSDPTQISWSDEIDVNARHYRSGATIWRRPGSLDNNDVIPIWLGGSDISYNFNARSYSSGSVVNPNERVIILNADSLFDDPDLSFIPIMDLRGIARVSNDAFFGEQWIIGGISNDRVLEGKVYALSSLEMPTSVNELTDFEILLYPNPAADWISLGNYPEAQQIGFRILNFQGRVLLEGSVSQRIDVSQLPKGQYIFELKDARGILDSRLIQIQ